MFPDIAEDIPQIRRTGPNWVWGVERKNSVPFGSSFEWASVRPEATNPDGYARSLLRRGKKLCALNRKVRPSIGERFTVP